MPSSSLKRLWPSCQALEKAPEDEKLKLAAENAQKAFELAKSGEKVPETFKDFVEKWVYSCEDQSALLDKLGGSRLMRLKNEPHLGYSLHIKVWEAK